MVCYLPTTGRTSVTVLSRSVEGKDLGHSDISRVVVIVYHTILYLWTARYWIGRTKSQQQIRLVDGRHCLGQEDIQKAYSEHSHVQAPLCTEWGYSGVCCERNELWIV